MKVVMLIGPPASGKSTYAKKRSEEEDIFRVSNDDLRLMFYGKRFVVRHEDAVFCAMYALVRELVEMGQSFILDNTNLSVVDRQRFFREVFGCRIIPPDIDIEIVDHFCNIPYEELIERDRNREASVGEDVISKMYRKVIDYKEYGDPQREVEIARWVAETVK